MELNGKFDQSVELILGKEGNNVGCLIIMSLLVTRHVHGQKTFLFVTTYISQYVKL